MSPDPYVRFRRRLSWTAVTAMALGFGFSTATLPSPLAPRQGFTLAIDRSLAGAAPTLEFRAPAEARPAPAPQGAAAPGRRGATLALSLATDRLLADLPYGREIRGAARRNGVDSLLLAAVVEAESGFRPDAVSAKGALGLMQLMPLHFTGIEQPLDPEVNLNLGARYLGDLRRRYDGDLALALAAYHAGPGAVERFGGVPPYRDTRIYVERVISLYHDHQQNLAAQLGALDAPPFAGPSGLGS